MNYAFFYYGSQPNWVATRLGLRPGVGSTDPVDNPNTKRNGPCRGFPFERFKKFPGSDCLAFHLKGYLMMACHVRLQQASKGKLRVAKVET